MPRITTPPPYGAEDGSFVWLEWYRNLNNLLDDLSEPEAHNDTTGLQGGSATERYHLTAAQHTTLLNPVPSGGLNATQMWHIRKAF